MPELQLDQCFKLGTAFNCLKEIFTAVSPVFTNLIAFWHSSLITPSHKYTLHFTA